MLQFLLKLFKKQEKHVKIELVRPLYRTEHHTSKEFNTSLKFPPDDIPFDEAIERIDYCIDSPMMYSNEPIKDIQSWAYIQFLASIGHTVLKHKKENTLVEWANTVQNSN